MPSPHGLEVEPQSAAQLVQFSPSKLPWHIPLPQLDVGPGVGSGVGNGNASASNANDVDVPIATIQIGGPPKMERDKSTGGGRKF